DRVFIPKMGYPPAEPYALLSEGITGQAPDVAVRTLLKHRAQELLVGRREDRREFITGQVVTTEPIARLLPGLLVPRLVRGMVDNDPDECLHRGSIFWVLLRQGHETGIKAFRRGVVLC